MSDADHQPRRLPPNPSAEHLRKQAKRLAKRDAVTLATAQKRLAADYGFKSWPALISHVDRLTPAAEAQEAQPLSAMSRAASAGDVAIVRRLLAEGQSADGGLDERGTPLWHACRGPADAGTRLAIASALIDGGAQVRRANANKAPAICAAAAHGPLTLVELLIRSGASTWQDDADKKSAIDYARAGAAPDRAAIIHLLDRPVIDDEHFRAAVTAIHRGDTKGLARLLDRHPGLLQQRAVEPDCYPQDYFRDPKLFWFIADNPNLTPTMPPDILATTQVMLDRGVDQSDLDYTLNLVMTSAPARRARLQIPLVRMLRKAGAQVSEGSILGTLGHKERRVVEALLKIGYPVTLTIAAGLGQTGALAALLPSGSAEEKQQALAMAVINGQVDCARALLDAGADPNGFLAMHSHSTAAHQAAINDDAGMLELLIAHGADLTITDKLWNGTPLGWAIFGRKSKARAALADRQ